MKTIYSFISALHPGWYLLVGSILIALSHVSFGVDLLAWISMVPFLLYLHRTKGFRSRILFSIVLFLTWILAISKIITDPIPPILVILYALPITIIHLPGYLIWSKIKNSKVKMLIFPMVMVVFEWIQYTLTPFASWGAAAYTQVDSMATAQIVSLFGIAGLSFLIYWINSVLAGILIYPEYQSALVPSTLLLILIIWGHLRMDSSRSRGTETMVVAAVGTDSEIAGLPLPSMDKNVADIRGVFERTKKVAAMGAQLVVWNEAAFYILPDQENMWKDSIRNLATEFNTNILASYVVPFNDDKFYYHNKYVFVLSDGSIDQEYLKHQPVPGEPAIKGLSHQQSAWIDSVRIGGAICYDYDFPYLARDNRKAGADIIGLPASDWRGIDPLHTQMAAFRAIEQGNSIVRSTRFGLSAAITPYGIMTAQMSSFDSNSKIMLAQVPLHPVRTLYSVIGDLFIWICLFGLLLFGIRSFYLKST